MKVWAETEPHGLADRVIDILAELFAVRGVPGVIGSNTAEGRRLPVITVDSLPGPPVCGICYFIIR